MLYVELQEYNVILKQEEYNNNFKGEADGVESMKKAVVQYD